MGVPGLETVVGCSWLPPHQGQQPGFVPPSLCTQLVCKPLPHALVFTQALAEKGVAFTPRYTDLFNGQSLSPQFLAINPKGTVPALVVQEPDGKQQVIADSRSVTAACLPACCSDSGGDSMAIINVLCCLVGCSPASTAEAAGRCTGQLCAVVCTPSLEAPSFDVSGDPLPLLASMTTCGAAGRSWSM